MPCLNVFTTPVTGMGCQQRLPLCVVQLKGKHYRKPHCHSGIVGTFELRMSEYTNLYSQFSKHNNVGLVREIYQGPGPQAFVRTHYIHNIFNSNTCQSYLNLPIQYVFSFLHSQKVKVINEKQIQSEPLDQIYWPLIVQPASLMTLFVDIDMELSMSTHYSIHSPQCKYIDVYVPCGPSMMDCPETSGNPPRRVFKKQTKSLVIPAIFELCTIKSALELPVILSIYQKPAGNPPETRHGLFLVGFRRFLDNPSLTDNTIC